jgi:antitoxin YqcF
MLKVTVSDEEKAIARFYEATIGSRPKFTVHRDSENDPIYVAVARADERPDDGMVTLLTNGISNYPLYTDQGTIYPDTRLELAASCYAQSAEQLQDMIYFAGSVVVKQRWFCRPGSFLQSAVSRFGDFGDMEHLYFTTPFAIEGLTTQIFGDRKVSWLQALPVSTAEVEFARAHSTDELEARLEDNDVDWADLRRSSVV